MHVGTELPINNFVVITSEKLSQGGKVRDQSFESLEPRMETLEPRDPENALYELHRRKSPTRVYCEHGALTPEIRSWARCGRIELVHFPYDPGSHTRRIPGIAEPSVAQICDLNLPIKDLPSTIEDYKGSEHFEKILAIVGCEKQYRRDALHVDSAFKSRCAIFVTGDSDILKHKAQLLDLLGIRFFDPNVELRDLELFIARDSS
jgi:hypothetical protein